MKIIEMEIHRIDRAFIESLNTNNIYKITRTNMIKQELWIFPRGAVKWISFKFGFSCGDVPDGEGLSINDGHYRGSYVLHPDQIDALIELIKEERCNHVVHAKSP